MCAFLHACMQSSASNATYWAISNEYNLLGLGLKDGNFRMFSFMKPEEDSVDTVASKTNGRVTSTFSTSFLELAVVAQHHEAAVTGIAFLDDIKTVVTCAFDSSVR